nr:MAG TPA: peptidase [Microviridae sp.]
MLKHSIMLKFNNVEMLKIPWKMLKTPAAGICLLCQKFFTKTLDKANRVLYNTEKEENAMEIKAYIVETQGNENITSHFKVKEFACKDGTPIVFVDDYLAIILNIARNIIKKPITITSGYRTVGHNAKVGGAKYSYHTRGMAADIRADGVKPKELAKVLNSIVPNSCGIIVYDNWVHFDTRDGKYRKGV